MGKYKGVCSVQGCSEPLYLGGLCEEHNMKREKAKSKRDAVINALETALIDGRMPDNQGLRDELMRIRKWWFRVCSSMQNNSKDNILLDETEYAFEWCIAIAQEIIDGEMEYRQGISEKPISKEIKRLVWERFENLEAGLMSNGVPRTRS